jgi:ABC-2 type transport system ATP-binding protein
MSATTYAIELEHLTRRFGVQNAVDDLSLRIPKGCTFGFLGPNGAGKTTTIRMLLHMLPITAGRARILGLDVTTDGPAIRQRVGLVPELHYIYRWMRVGDVLAFCRALYHTWSAVRCQELLELFELPPTKRVKHLSKGMLAKLALLVAVAHEPEVLILDEPTSGLDPLIREEFLEGVLRTICTGGRTILFSSHMLSDVQRLADRIGVIYAGRLLVDSPTDELITGTKRIRAVLRDGYQPTNAPAGTIWQRQENREWLLTVRNFSPTLVEDLRAQHPLENIEVSDVGLEDIFKDLIRGRRVPA